MDQHAFSRFFLVFLFRFVELDHECVLDVLFTVKGGESMEESTLPQNCFQSEMLLLSPGKYISTRGTCSACMPSEVLVVSGFVCGAYTDRHWSFCALSRLQ